jgi:hypothetical protein
MWCIFANHGFKWICFHMAKELVAGLITQFMCLPTGAAAIREASSPAALLRHRPVQKVKPRAPKEEVSKRNGTQKARSHISGEVMLLKNANWVSGKKSSIPL